MAKRPGNCAEPHHTADPFAPLHDLGFLSQTPSDGAFQGATHISFLDYTRAEQNRFIDCPVRFQANRLKNFFRSECPREYQTVQVKSILLKVAGWVPGGVAI